MPDDTCDVSREYNNLGYEYNTLMSSLHVSVSKHLLDEHFTVIWANDFYYEKTGYSKEEYEAIYHNHVSEYYRNDPEIYAQIGATISAALEKGEPRYECACRMPQKGGSYMWIKVVGTFTQETINGVPVIYCVFTDITDLMQTRMEQTVTYDNLPGFIAKFRVGSAEGQKRFTFVDANDRFIRFFGGRAAEEPLYSLVNLDTEQNRHVIDEHFPAMLEGRPVRFVVQARDREGNDTWLQLNADCIDHMQGDPVYLVVYIDITDITEQRELHKKLEERSEMLCNALEMAERANRAKSDFLSRMSHDIRTPMNAIMGMLAIAKESRDDPERVTDCLNKVESSAKFLLTLINDILDMSKIESGKMVLKKKPFDFASFLRNITTMFYTQATKKQVSFQVNVGRELAEAYVGDELKLNQIVINLLGNAVKFTDPGGTVSFAVAGGKQADRSTEIVFTVRDSGMGMERSFLDKIFQPFEQDSRQRENRGGSGLGLAIAGNYARMMNGGIDVESEPGAGSIFTARIWLDTVEAREPVALKARFRPLKALVVDSDRESRGYVISLLEKFGVAAEGAGGGEDALARLNAAAEGGKPFTILILDWKWPPLASADLVRNIRERFGRDALTIAAAAYDWSGIRSEALDAGADAFLQKPLFPSTVYDFLVTATQDAPVPVKAKEEERFRGERVLLVEDNDINLEIAVTLLESRNLRVETARDGLEAVEMFERSDPGRYLAILMDIQMPVLDGLEATRRIRALAKPDAGTVPIIAMSANAFDEDVEKSLEAGMNGHISKPIDIPALFEALRGVRRDHEPVGM